MARSTSQWFQRLTVILITGLVGVGTVFLWARTKRQEPSQLAVAPTLTGPATGGNRQLLVEGFTTVNYAADGTVASRLRLGKCELRTKLAAFWLFETGPILEVHDMQVDLFHWRAPDQASSNPAVPESSEAIAALTRLPRQLRWGAVGGLDVRNVVFNLHADGQPDTVIRAQHLTPGAGGELTLEKAVSVSAQAGRRQLTSDAIIWWPHVGVLAVKGDYQLTEAGPPRHGTRRLFNLALDPITNQQEISHYEERIMHKAELAVVQ